MTELLHLLAQIRSVVTSGLWFTLQASWFEHGNADMLPIKTNRILLRALSMADAPAIAEGIRPFEVIKWLAVPPYPYAASDAEAFLEQRWASRTGVDATAGLISEGRLCGICSIEPRDRGPVLGYWLAQPAWGRGLMTEAARALLTQFFNHGDADQVVSGYFAGNRASARVLEKLGFQAVGDGVMFNRPQGRDLPHVDVVLTRERFQALTP
jgi:RimJ/RimL family protein N-acetyltransferase